MVRMDIAGPAVEVEVGGVTYEVLVPLFLWPELSALRGEDGVDDEPAPEIAVFVHYSATANQPAPVLVGFLRRPERDFFRKFITVEGIGPAKAVKAMNVSVSTIARAIEQEDRHALTRLPGIGTRAADKIIASLRGKVAAEAALQDGHIAQAVDPARIEGARAASDAVEAVVALGYPRGDARRWVDEARQENPDLETVEHLTLAVLKRLGAGG
jgi:Holliday junction DNA helicase RuvA